MKNYDPLWKLLRATTNSPNDVWKPRHYERHDNVPDSLLGTAIKRYTVPIMKVMDIKDDEIYLVIQFSTDMMEFPYFVIDKSAFTKELKAKEEYVYAFNVRLCLRAEFIFHHRHQLNVTGEVKKEFRIDILNKSLNLIRTKPRHLIMKMMLNTDKYKDLSKHEIKNILYAGQFDNWEKDFKVIKDK